MNSTAGSGTNEPSPSTPPRGRIPSRYLTPSRGQPARVPLHRRGTSRTYERLEDLLKEAGYKETKIYSPEVDRTESSTEEGRGRSGVRSGMDAVVEFISGWIPGSSTSNSLPPEDTVQPRERSTSPSPLPSSRIPSHQVMHGRSLRPRSSATDSLRAYAQRSAAQGYLRHMASTPNMIKKSGSSDAIARRLPASRSHQIPPMPSNWLDSVTKAVVGSSTSGVHIGGPSSKRVSSRTSHNSPGGNKEGRHSSSARAKRLRPLTGYLQPKAAPGALSTVRVVCRSAPASRSSSLSGDRRALPTDKGKQKDTRSSKGKKSGKSTNNLPSLASTRVENDIWATQWMDGRRISTSQYDEIEETDSDDDEGELDLTRILVDPKRQHSIRSLRRTLHRSESARALRENAIHQKEPWMIDDDEGGSTRRGSKLRNTNRRTSIEDGSGFSWGDVPGFDLPQTRRRRGMPGTWSIRTVRS